MKLRLRTFLTCVQIVPIGPGGAQTTATGSPVAVDHSVPFGTVPGKLLVLDNYLVFLDEQQPGASFVVAKSAVGIACPLIPRGVRRPSVVADLRHSIHPRRAIVFMTVIGPSRAVSPYDSIGGRG